jgi:hypothetical protein
MAGIDVLKYAVAVNLGLELRAKEKGSRELPVEGIRFFGWWGQPMSAWE